MKTTSPAVLLLGSGYTLVRLAARLPRDGFVLTSRRAQQVEEWRGRGFAAARAESGDSATLERTLSDFPGLQMVIDSVPPPRGVAAALLEQEARTRGELFRRAGISRVVYLSTTGVFGVEDGSVVTELTPSSPRNPLAAARFAVEEGYRASGVQFSAVRVPAIYGPGRGLGLSLQHGSMKLIEHGERWTNRVHVEDLVQYLYALIAAPKLPEIVCAGDAAPALQREVVQYYAQKFGLPLPESISIDQARAAGLYTQLANQRIDSTRSREVLGITLRYPSFREGAGAEFSPEIDPLAA